MNSNVIALMFQPGTKRLRKQWMKANNISKREFRAKAIAFLRSKRKNDTGIVPKSLHS
jgi:hypothetical protein